MMRPIIFLRIIVFLLSMWPLRSEAAGPWKAQVVDAETGKPLEGAIVLAVWYSYAGSLAGLADQRYYDSEEVVTGPDAHFEISGRSYISLSTLFRAVKGPHIYIFKPGYGQWRFRGAEAWLKLETYERNKRFEEAWRNFEGDGAVIELPLLKTREERLNFLSHIYWPPETPPEKVKHMREAENKERSYLGLGRLQ